MGGRREFSVARLFTKIPHAVRFLIIVELSEQFLVWLTSTNYRLIILQWDPVGSGLTVQQNLWPWPGLCAQHNRTIIEAWNRASKRIKKATTPINLQNEIGLVNRYCFLGSNP